MMFFRRMNEKEKKNSIRAVLLGFYTYMIVSFINFFFYLLVEKELFSSAIVFWSGLLVYFGYSAYLDLKDKKKSARSRDGS
ncbi:hypothetical protein PGH26_08995 [Sporosarcina jeotgali]|uniref:Uncharacterized protein n=1 Tax=Sporosarcina jeotgali TaxID=3020056 RepID=A0ABZ0KTA9_9BACL|nr:hypothetical protein [Sporosarcina sp. B2O-1]WOV83072.1 hypothetical protein PGH26_08995 [Sporosarcina sp. B2O-1]